MTISSPVGSMWNLESLRKERKKSNQQLINNSPHKQAIMNKFRFFLAAAASKEIKNFFKRTNEREKKN